MASILATTTDRLMPLVCFNCGMPLNNKQVAFDALIDAGASARDAFEAMHIDKQRLCCRTILRTSARAPQLDTRAPPRPKKCARLTSLPLIGGPVVTLSTDGSTAPLAVLPPPLTLDA
jgi:DNA-directed RNA polymerase subunit N (RpoN/RPB10)